MLMLDEVDKLGRDFRGDPAAALLEILDPEQNKTFRDNYLDLPFDLSKVLFVTTANCAGYHSAAFARSHGNPRLAGYTEDEKVHIANRFLIPPQAKEHGVVLGEQIGSTDESLHDLIHHYTRNKDVPESRTSDQNSRAEAARVSRRRVRQRKPYTPDVIAKRWAFRISGSSRKSKNAFRSPAYRLGSSGRRWAEYRFKSKPARCAVAKDSR